MTCKQCGECCRTICFGMAYGGADWNEYYFRRGCKVVDGVGMLVPSVCPHLQEYLGTPSRFFCDIFETRPALCRTDTKRANMRFYRPPGCTND